VTWTLRLLPDGRSCAPTEPLDLASAASLCDVLLDQPCGSKRTCGKCRVRVVDGDVPAGDADRRVLAADLIRAGWRLGCALVVDRDATIEIPPGARALHPKSFGGDDLFAGGFEPAEPDAIRATAARGRVPLGVAIDAGSTTLAVALVELRTGRVLATASSLNPQVRFGADVMSRIRHAQEHPDGNRQLHEALAGSLDELVVACAGEAAVTAADIVAAACVGNPTMMHSLLSCDVTPLGTAPFEGALRDAWHGDVAATGLRVLPSGVPVYVAPVVRSHVGADAVAAMLATGLDRASRPAVLVDLGTNTEVSVGSRDAFLCASAAAGPAFEGATIHQGMRATAGAIDQLRVRADGSIRARTIGHVQARGICGSGLVDAASELLRAEVIEPSGRLRPPYELPEAWRQRVVELPLGGRAVRLTDTAAPIHLTAMDIRQLQVAKGSIAACVRLLMERLGVRPPDLGDVWLAGAFGGWIRKTSAVAIGLVPAVDPERIRFVGDAAAVGARMLLVDASARERAHAIARRAGYVELGGTHAYADAFVDCLAFPAGEEVAA